MTVNVRLATFLARQDEFDTQAYDKVFLSDVSSWKSDEQDDTGWVHCAFSQETRVQSPFSARSFF